MTNDDKMAKKEETGMVVPEHIEDSDAGTEDLDSSDLILPRIKIAQPTAKEHTEGEVPLGNWADNLNMDDYGKEIDVVCLFVKKGWVKFKPIKDGGGMLARKFEGDFLIPVNPELITDKDKVWDNENGIPPATTYAFLCLINNSEIAIISLRSTGVKTAKKWASMLKKLIKGRKSPAYARHYKLSTEKKANKDGQVYYEPEVTAGTFLNKEEYETVKKFHEEFSKKKIEVDLSDSASGEAKSDEPVPF